MNDLGWTLGWLGLQVCILLIPAIGLHALASRRGPVAGAWVATVGLGMVVFLTFLTLLPVSPGMIKPRASQSSRPSISQPGDSARVPASLAFEGEDRGRLADDRGRAFAGFRLAWNRLERRAAEPVARLRPWGKIVAVLALAGSGIGLLRLLVGLWAVGLCRSRGHVVVDPGMVRLVEQLRLSMGCDRAVELREVPDLTTPATAGWRRPMLLLPSGWRGWDDSERRAVVAHELAHVVRNDYASGLLARVAVVLNYYHPLVRWLAGRLHLEQELAADAMGAQFAGGRSSYLLALSRLALEQEERPSSWPARAFLPSRGTLIRRIAMLKNENESKINGQTWSKSRRLATAVGLLALTIGLASWKAPASAADDKSSPAPPSGSKVEAADARTTVPPFDMSYVPDGMSGAVAFRPAAIGRRIGIDLLNLLIREELGGDVPGLAKKLGVDVSRPGFVKLAIADIEAIACGFTFGKPVWLPGDDVPDKALHSLMFGGVTVRTVASFDWPAFFRQWTFDLEEVKEPRGVYYKIKDPNKSEILMGCVFYQPDGRTLVIESEKRIKELIAREIPSSPAYLRGADWDRVSRSMVAVALNNQGDSFSKVYDLGRADDKLVLQLVRGIDRWVFGVPDTEAISLRGEAIARDPNSATSVATAIEALVNMGSAALTAMMAPEEDLPKTGVQADALRMYRSLLAKLKPRVEGASVAIHDEEFGRFADLAPIIKMEMATSQPKAKAEEAKGDIKAEKR